jgi:MOSC domain-containing protein YiiM
LTPRRRRLSLFGQAEVLLGDQRIEQIFISDKAGEPMRAVPEVRAVAGKGLEGDRYFADAGTFSKKKTPDRHVTLIEAEAIEALHRDYDIHLGPGEARRNLITRGVALNHLVGKEFAVGEVSLRGIKLCEPCAHLEKLTREGVRAALVHRGGLRAEILVGGRVKVGDAIRENAPGVDRNH